MRRDLGERSGVALLFIFFRLAEKGVIDVWSFGGVVNLCFYLLKASSFGEKLGREELEHEVVHVCEIRDRYG
jgi:hypothetical protein